jgi:glycosyltransferase involved in cell wall biosynthesis
MAVIIRAHNEENTIGKVIKILEQLGEKIWVSASGCTDNTVLVAREAGAEIFITPLGLGASTCASLEKFVNEEVVFVDGDLFNLNIKTVELLRNAAKLGFIGKGAMSSAGRSSSLLPDMAKDFGVELPNIPPQALTSAYSSYPAGFADMVDLTLVPAQRGSDLMLSLLAHNVGLETVIVPAGPREHRNRGEAHIDILIEGNKATLKKFSQK